MKDDANLGGGKIILAECLRLGNILTVLYCVFKYTR